MIIGYQKEKIAVTAIKIKNMEIKSKTFGNVLFNKTINCKHREFLISDRDSRIKEPLTGKKEVHACGQISVWQEPAKMKRYYIYADLEASEI